jgi:hypothetical protein
MVRQPRPGRGPANAQEKGQATHVAPEAATRGRTDRSRPIALARPLAQPVAQRQQLAGPTVATSPTRGRQRGGRYQSFINYARLDRSSAAELHRCCGTHAPRTSARGRDDAPRPTARRAGRQAPAGSGADGRRRRSTDYPSALGRAQPRAVITASGHLPNPVDMGVFELVRASRIQHSPTRGLGSRGSALAGLPPRPTAACTPPKFEDPIGGSSMLSGAGRPPGG